MPRGRPKLTDEEKQIRNEAKEKENASKMAVVEEMASLLTSKEDIADMLLMTVDELEKMVYKASKVSLDKIMAKAVAKRKLSLKNDMFALSKKNGTVAIHLSKLYLEQEEDTGAGFAPMEVQVVDGTIDEEETE